METKTKKETIIKKRTKINKKKSMIFNRPGAKQFFLQSATLSTPEEKNGATIRIG